MEPCKSVLLCVLAIVLLADIFTATPIRSRHSRHLRPSHFRAEQELEEAFSILDAENAFNSRMERSRNANRRRRSFPNETVIAVRHCIRQLVRARRRNPLRRFHAVPENIETIYREQWRRRNYSHNRKVKQVTNRN